MGCLIDEKTPEEDLDFTDDSYVMLLKLEDPQTKTNNLTQEVGRQRWDFLQVNVEKMEVMRIPNQQQQAPITINARNLKELVSFTYLPRQHRFNYRQHRHR
ncbi:unnamed protein product [Heterobilharzia americana]|nr:unnamed protein product [Heterobilharzia americana]